MPTIKEQQEALLHALEDEKRRRAQEQLLIAQNRESEGIFVHPMMQTPYKWVGPHLVQIGPRYLDGIDGFFFKGRNGLGQAPTVLDPWGQPTTGLPISVRREIEWEEEERRAMCQVAPFSRECQGELGDYGAANVYRVDNLITGRTRWPTYAIAYKDKWGMQQLATGKKHPHLAVEELQAQIRLGRVSSICPDFDPSKYGYDYKMFIYTAPLH